MDVNQNEFFNELAKNGIHINEEQKLRIQEKINSVLTYEPKIGVLGKTSVGKSSLCNALFGQDVCPISDVESCTRDPKEVLLSMGNKGITLVDVPGIGESAMRDQEYAQLYSKLLPELDVILWLLKADDRAYSSDEFFYKNIVKPHIDKGKPFFFVLNQCDKIEPSHKWDHWNNRPGITQFSNIYRKIDAISAYFDIASSKVIPISVKYKYNLIKLIDEVTYALPREKKHSFLHGVTAENRSANSTSAVKKAWYEILGEFLICVVESSKEIVLKVLDKPGGIIGTFLGKLFGF